MVVHKDQLMGASAGINGKGNYATARHTLYMLIFSSS